MTTLQQHLQAIYDEHGKLTPKLVVDTARDPQHPLHGSFEWDDKQAAEAHRREQARNLIQRVKIVYREAAPNRPPQTIRAYHSIRTPDRGYTYEPTKKIVEDPLMVKVLMNDMEREWRTLQRRYEAFEEFWQMVQKSMEERPKSTTKGRSRRGVIKP